MSADENKAVVRRLFEELRQGNDAILDEHPGLEEIRANIPRLRNAVENGGGEMRVVEMFGEGEWVAVRTEMQGGPWGQGFETLAMYRVVDGKIVKQHSQGGPTGVHEVDIPG